MQKARILLSSTDIGSLNEICASIKELAQKTKMKGPIPLPTKKLKITTRKTPCGDGKASFDHFEMRVHKRMIDLGIDERALRLIMRVPIPEGVQITIDLLD
ncbi:MAG: 30S ribosomal protein S10 [Candidatus Nanoarchaeia archaeon]|nr:30S ribosomal protein S10 [Candidatus Nanoarchaeia archaeon]